MEFENIFTVEQCQGSRLGISCITATTYLVQPKLDAAICTIEYLLATQRHGPISSI
jgi:hypothetical protein